jgi:hypothetical protein
VADRQFQFDQPPRRGPAICRVGVADDVLDHPECLADVSERFGIVEGIGAQNPEPFVSSGIAALSALL